jgi:hypothetical protein
MSIEELAMITERIARDADRKMMKALRVARFNRERRSEQATPATETRPDGKGGLLALCADCAAGRRTCQPVGYPADTVCQSCADGDHSKHTMFYGTRCVGSARDGSLHYCFCVKTA